MDEELFIRLRDCFTAGYTFPQFCIDNKIKRPLFVAEGKLVAFMWEIYVQFSYDKRMSAQFCFLDASNVSIRFSPYTLIEKLNVKHISQVNPAEIDAVICLTSQKIFPDSKVIYLDALVDYFECKVYFEIPLLHFLQRHPKVKPFLINVPIIVTKYKGGADFHSQLASLEELDELLRTDKSGTVKTRLDKFGYTNAQVLEISEAPKVKANPDGSTLLIDDDTKFLQRIKNGKRMTAYQPEHYKNKIYFFCGCHYYGIHAPFDKTVASYLQKMLNENNMPYRVENESQCFFARGQDIYYNINKINPSPGDIIFLSGRAQSIPNLPFIDLSDAFAPPLDFREFFCTKYHMNELGYKVLAEKLFTFLTANNFFRDVEFKYPPPPVNLSIATVYRRNSRREALRLLSTKSWKLTSRHFGRKKFQSARSS